jgi:hypothetical protein
LTTSNAALDLAHVSQTSPRNHSEWPQFTGAPRGSDGLGRSERRNVTNPNVTLSTPTDEIPQSSAGILSGTSPIIQQLSQGQVPLSRRSSPPSLLDSLTVNRSVPATPMGLPHNAAHLLQTSGSPLTPDLQALNGRTATPNSQLNDDIQASLSRMPSAGPDSASLGYNQVPHDEVGLKWTDRFS